MTITRSLVTGQPKSELYSIRPILSLFFITSEMAINQFRFCTTNFRSIVTGLTNLRVFAMAVTFEMTLEFWDEIDIVRITCRIQFNSKQNEQ